MKKIIGSLVLGVMLAAPVMASEVGVATTKPLSIIQFSSLPENQGVPHRAIQGKYVEYRSGRYVPASTLDASRVR